LANKATDSTDKPEDKKCGGSYMFTVFKCKQLHALASSTEKTEADVDSGASIHYCPNHSKFITYRTIDEQNIYAADGQSIKAIGKGNIKIYLPYQGNHNHVTLCEVYHVPDMTTTLISVACLDRARYFVHFGQGICCIKAPIRTI
jgi:hypothetical protein